MPATLLEDIRFGYGPVGSADPLPGILDPGRLMAQLDGPDPADARWARPSLADRLALREQARAEGLARKADPALPATANEALKVIAADDLRIWVPRAATTPVPFRERLVNLWCNRLTIGRGSGILPQIQQPFRDEVVRAHVAGSFPDMLAASVFHPAMLVYLDQVRSVGPNSVVGRQKGLGLNENLARELLELHSMGSGYSQADVTETARLLAGLTFDGRVVKVDPRAIERGPKTILGTTYRAGEDEIRRFLRVIALRPETAQSVAQMLAAHFLADVPPPGVVAAVREAYLAGDGDLRACYAALLERPEAADPELRKVRAPLEYIAATLRALGLSGLEAGEGAIPAGGLPVMDTMARLGQPVHRPLQPDGFPDTSDAWMTPPMLAARIDWAVMLARVAAGDAEPGPLAARVLGDLGGTDTHQAVRRAEQRWEGVAVLFGAPDFMRR